MEEVHCDFCHSTTVKWDYPTDDFMQELKNNTPTVEWNSIGDWAACNTCHDMIEADAREMLATRACKSFIEEYGPSPNDAEMYRKIRILHDEFFAMRSGPPKEV